MSIRTRLTIGVAALLLVTFGILGVVIVRTTEATLVDQVDARIREAAVRAGPRGGPGGPGGPFGRDGGDGDRDGPPSGFAGGSAARPAEDPSGDGSAEDDVDPFERPVADLRFAADGTLLKAVPSGYPDDPDSLPAVPALPGEGDRLLDRIVTVPAVDGSLDYRLLIQREPDGDYVVCAAPLTAVGAAVSRIIRAILIAGAGALLVAALASWGLIRRGLRPVDRMVETAAAIAAGDLARRVPDADPRTELGRLGAALNEMLHQIEQALQARAASEDRLRHFVADAAHELRTPLTSLRGYAELYRQGALATPEAVAGAMGRIESEGARMARLVDDLLLLARLDQQRGLEREPVDLVAVVGEATADFAAVEPDRPLTRALAGEAIVLGDRSRLRQVVDNLLANVRTHTPAGTPVHVAVRPTGREVEVVVADEGPGIAADAKPKVFERFWRADAGRTRSRGGTGLGLAIVASLVQAHGGAVDVASEPGRGAVFTVRLPLASLPEPARRPAGRREDRAVDDAAPAPRVTAEVAGS